MGSAHSQIPEATTGGNNNPLNSFSDSSTTSSISSPPFEDSRAHLIRQREKQLILAARWNDKTKLVKVLHLGVDPNAIQDGITALHAAIMHESLNCIKILLTHPYINPLIPTREGENALHLACKMNNLETAKEVVGMLMNSTSSICVFRSGMMNGKGGTLWETPLHLSCRNGRSELVSILLSPFQDFDFTTPTLQQLTLKTILKHNVPYYLYKDRLPPDLYLHLETQRLQLLKKQRSNARPKTTSSSSSPSTSLSPSSSSFSSSSTSSSRSCSPASSLTSLLRSRGDEDETPRRLPRASSSPSSFSSSFSSSHLEFQDEDLELRRINLDALDRDNNTPLHKAIQSHSLSCVALLSSLPVINLHFPNKSGLSSWEEALLLGDVQIIQHLLSSSSSGSSSSSSSSSLVLLDKTSLYRNLYFATKGCIPISLWQDIYSKTKRASSSSSTSSSPFVKTFFSSESSASPIPIPIPSTVFSFPTPNYSSSPSLTSSFFSLSTSSTPSSSFTHSSCSSSVSSSSPSSFISFSSSLLSFTQLLEWRNSEGLTILHTAASVGNYQMISWIKDELKASLTRRRSHRSRHRHSAPSLIFAPFLSSSFGSPSSSSSSPSSLVPSVNYKVLMRRLILEKDTGCLEGTVIHYAAIAPSESTSKTIETLLECFPRNGKSRKRLLLTSRAKDGSLPLNWSSGSQGNISSLKTLLKVSIECLQQQKKEQKQELENNWKKEKTNRLSSFFRQRILTELEGQEEDMKDAYKEEEGDEEEEDEVEEEEEEELSDDPNLVFVDDMGFTPLHRVAELTKEAEERIRMLLEAGFRTDMKNKKGELPYDVTLARIGRFCRTSKSPMALLLKPKQSLQLQPSRLTSNGG